MRMIWAGLGAALVALSGCGNTNKTDDICTGLNQEILRAQIVQNQCLTPTNPTIVSPESCTMALASCTGSDEDALLSTLNCLKAAGDPCLADTGAAGALAYSSELATCQSQMGTLSSSCTMLEQYLFSVYTQH